MPKNVKNEHRTNVKYKGLVYYIDKRTETLILRIWMQLPKLKVKHHRIIDTHANVFLLFLPWYPQSSMTGKLTCMNIRMSEIPFWFHLPPTLIAATFFANPFLLFHNWYSFWNVSRIQTNKKTCLLLFLYWTEKFEKCICQNSFWVFLPFSLKNFSISVLL